MATTPYPFVANAVLTASQLNSTYNIPVSTKTASYTLVAADGGTRVAMNSASATTITVNTSVFSAGDSLWIQNIGAGTCTITAGTATVTTSGSLALAANAGGTLYFTSASAAIFFGSGAANDWAAWTPTWANLTVGNATQTARYVQSGKTVFFSLKLVLGSTSSVGTGPTFTWPVTAASTASAQASVVQVVFLDANMAPYLGASDPRVRTTTVCGIFAPSGTVQLQEQDRVVSAGGPFTWVSTDTIWVSGMFEAA